ncbi:protein YIF1B-B-like [Oscarella lobularis]|uniref:protein YIF1B-B-like n=1 Tax=Oscarella lobularis TaxID=121494 RepID=UPI003313A3C6
MDPPAEAYMRNPSFGQGGPPQLFEDTSNQMPGSQFVNDPMANVAMQYGSHLAGKGREIVDEKVNRFLSTSRLKYYFAVDTKYVLRKLSLLIFPFHHTNWSVTYNKSEPVVPRYSVNAPDLYIPTMAFVTYVLLIGLIMGVQQRFSPDQLGIAASSALVWLCLEVGAITISIYLLNITADLRTLDLLAFCGYKYVGMISILIAGLLIGNQGYYGLLIWKSITLAYFLSRTLSRIILPATSTDGVARVGKRRNLLLIIVAFVQPLFMWWLTSNIISYQPRPKADVL